MKITAHPTAAALRAITNTENIKLEDVSVHDEFAGLSGPEIEWSTKKAAEGGITSEKRTLEPSESVLAYATYTVSEEDITRGRIDNTAWATGSVPGSTDKVESNKSDVTVEVAKADHVGDQNIAVNPPAPAPPANIMPTGDGSGGVVLAILIASFVAAGAMVWRSRKR